MTYKLSTESNSALLNLKQIDFIGFQETFTEDLQRLSLRYNFHSIKNIPKKNVTPNKKVANLTKTTTELLKIINDKDIKLYQKAKELKKLKRNSL